MQQTKAQKDLVLAESLVSQAEGKSGKIPRIYGGLCHNFPVLVRTCGLCQAVAFSKAKAVGESDIAKAHQLLLEHIGEVLGKGSDPLEAIRNASAMEYMLLTRQVLSIWIYFKRFATSILKADPTDSPAGEDGVA